MALLVPLTLESWCPAEAFCDAAKHTHQVPESEEPQESDWMVAQS